MKSHDIDPVHVSLIAGPRGEDPQARIVVNGVDLTRHVRGFRVEAGVGALTDVWLDLIGVTVDIQADVPRSRIQALTSEQDDVRQGAKQQRDLGRGQRDYRKPNDGQGELLLALSLGQVKA
jgi:hypothetical protein